MTLLAEIREIGTPDLAAPAQPSAAVSAAASQVFAGPAEAPKSWLQSWCETPSLEQRLVDINVLMKTRLASHQAAEAWLHLLAKVTGMTTPEQMESLVRQFLRLAPDHAKACVMFDLLFNKDRGNPPGPQLVFMITSCERYIKQARRVLADLRARGANACIMIGDPTLSVPVQVEDGDVVVLPVADTYEALTSKVLEGLTYLRRRHGAISVVKIDDDIALNDNFDPTALLQSARTYEYAGQSIGGFLDRCWHFGKTSVAVPIMMRRGRGRFAYGPMYLLGPRALEHLVRDWVFYPGEFDGYIYEDLAIGEALRRASIEVTNVSIDRMGGVVDHAQRYVAKPY